MAFLTLTVSVSIVQQQSVKIEKKIVGVTYWNYLFNVHLFTIVISKKKRRIIYENSFI